MYLPANQTVFTCAYSSALAAMNISSRPFLPSALSSYYTDVAAIAGAFAQQFDTLWTSARNPTELELRLIQAACNSIWEDVPPPSLTNVSSLPSTYRGVCQSILSMLTAATDYYTSQSIVPAPAASLPVLGRRKTLVSAALTPLFSVDMSDPVIADSISGVMQFCAECTNGTDTQARIGNANIAIAYKPSTATFTEAVAALLQTIAATAGTLTTVFSWSNVGTVATLNVTGTSSLAAVTDFIFNYSLSFVSHPNIVYL